MPGREPPLLPGYSRFTVGEQSRLLCNSAFCGGLMLVLSLFPNLVVIPVLLLGIPFCSLFRVFYAVLARNTSLHGPCVGVGNSRNEQKLAENSENN